MLAASTMCTFFGPVRAAETKLRLAYLTFNMSFLLGYVMEDYKMLMIKNSQNRCTSTSTLPANAQEPKNFVNKSITMPEANPTKSKVDI